MLSLEQFERARDFQRSERVQIYFDLHPFDYQAGFLDDRAAKKAWNAARRSGKIVWKRRNGSSRDQSTPATRTNCAISRILFRCIIDPDPYDREGGEKSLTSAAGLKCNARI